MSYNLASVTDRATAIQASRRKLEETIDEPYKPEDHDVRKLTKWIIAVFTLFLSYVQLAFYDIEDRIQELEKPDEDNEPSPSHSPTAATTATTTQRATSAPTRSRRRCAKCHAKGHDELECHTKDPAANRRRVAINQRKKKEVARPPTHPFPADPRFYSYAPIAPPAVMPPEGYAALAADAHELRRRNNQSAQDKRRARRSSARTT